MCGWALCYIESTYGHGRVATVRQREAGFSLVELILVMAITSSLVVIAFVGQRGLRSRAQFDAAIDKVVATIADAHSQATAAVNLVGTGKGVLACVGGPAGTPAAPYVFAGVAWSADNAVPGGPLKLDYYEALPGTIACSYQTQAISLPSAVSVTTGGRELFVRDNTGGLSICPVPDLATNVLSSFQNGACTAPVAPGSLTLTFTDADGHSSQVKIDASGLAKRLN
jgi:prepilin-type N-terminal cleavage/methylation domain-containing protein